MRLTFAFILFAQAALATTAAESISGVSGWVQNGLFGLYIYWHCFVETPANRKQINDLIGTHNLAVKEIVTELRETTQESAAATATQTKELRDDYRQSLVLVTNHCEKNTAQICQALRKDLMEEIQKAMKQ